MPRLAQTLACTLVSCTFAGAVHSQPDPANEQSLDQLESVFDEGTNRTAKTSIPASPVSTCGIPAPPPIWNGTGPQPIWDMTREQIDALAARLQRDTPDLRERIRLIAERTVGQPFSIYTLGEAPFELHDHEPMSDFANSDALTWIEQTLALALADDWPTYFAWLQRIRYEDGRIGLATRNHYTEAQWNPGNHWLYRDISAELPGSEIYDLHIKLADFLQREFSLHTDRPDLFVTTAFLPWPAFEQVMPRLRTGDVIQYVVTENGKHWVNTLALIEVDKQGKAWKYQPYAGSGLRRVELAPEIRSQAEFAASFADAQRRADEHGIDFEPFIGTVGVKLLQLTDDPVAKLRAIDGPHAPVVTFAPYAPLPASQP